MAEYDATRTAWNALFMDIQKDIAASQPASLLLFTMLNLDVEKTFQAPHTAFIHSTETLSKYLESPPANRLFDLAIVALNTDDVRDERYAHLISRLRDTDCARIYLACGISAKTADRYYDVCFRALAFRLMRIYHSSHIAQKQNVCLYYYDIYDYKEVPDWLNNRYWAHPQMWNKARW